MIKELAQFTRKALEDPVFREYGVTPKDGLHIVLSVERADGATHIGVQPVFSGLFYAKKRVAVQDWWLRCTSWWKASTMLGTVDTSKVFDVPAKAIHTVSPFCIGLKRTNLPGGEQYLTNQAQNKSQVFDRTDNYFDKALAYIEDPEDKAIAEAFRIAFRNPNQVQQWVETTGDFTNVKDADYVIFYLDLSIERYEAVSRRYLKEKLFNTDKYNMADPNAADPEQAQIYGTSNWLNAYPSKKPFLTHQSASFDIAGRITASDAGLLYEFDDLVRRKLLPNPLPLFIMEADQGRAFKIFKDELDAEEGKRKGYLDIIEEMQERGAIDVANYYLLFMQGGEIKDFDFVSKFEYQLDADGTPWTIKDLFGTGHTLTLNDVKDLMLQVLPDLFSNSLIVRRKDKNWIFKWFDELDPVYCKTHNAYLMALKYRKAFYDFIYKSQRQSVTEAAIKDILIRGILDDIRLDKVENGYHKEHYSICTKLNLLFGLTPYFSKNQHSIFMASKIEYYREKIGKLVSGEGQLASDEEFAFATGQVVARLFAVSVSEDKSYSYLEPFLTQSTANGLKSTLMQFFNRYKHGKFSQRFEHAFSEVMAYELEGALKPLMPIFIAGVFSNNQLFAEKKAENS